MAVRWWHICDYKPTALVHIWTEADGTASDWNEIWIWVCRDGLVVFSVNEVDCVTNEYYLAEQNGTASSFESKDGTHYYIKTGGWALRMFASTDKLTEQPAYYVQKLLNRASKYTKKWADFDSIQHIHWLVKQWLEFIKVGNRVYAYYK